MKAFGSFDKLMDEFDDLPQAPGEPGAVEAGLGTLSADDFADVPSMGEAIPVGTYHFRLESYTKGGKVPTNKDGSPATFDDGTPIPAQPWLMLQWTCQQEPHTGRRFGDIINWVSEEVTAKANAGDSAAKLMRKNRLMAAKAVLEAAGYKVSGKFNFEADFLATNPELKIQLGLRPGKSKNPKTGKYDIETGEMQNRAIKYVPLGRPS